MSNDQNALLRDIYEAQTETRRDVHEAQKKTSEDISQLKTWAMEEFNAIRLSQEKRRFKDLVRTISTAALVALVISLGVKGGFALWPKLVTLLK